jgi:hypothetical protein
MDRYPNTHRERLLLGIFRAVAKINRDYSPAWSTYHTGFPEDADVLAWAAGVEPEGLVRMMTAYADELDEVFSQFKESQ